MICYSAYIKNANLQKCKKVNLLSIFVKLLFFNLIHMKSHTIIALTAFLFMLSQAAKISGQVNIKVDINTSQKYGKITALDRSKFFNMHETPGSVNQKEMDELKELGISMGRGTFSPFAGSNVLKGTTDEEIQKQANNWIKSLKSKDITITKDLMNGIIVTSHPTPKTSAGGKYAFRWKGDNADYSDEVKFAERFFKITFTDNGIDPPSYYEPMNEPFVKAGGYDGISQERVRKEMSRYHQQMAAGLKKAFPDMKVGGYASAWPLFEGFHSDFEHWKGRMKMFIDVAGKDCDFISFHIYDGRNVTGAPLYRSGSNMEALIDIIEGYTEIKFGKRKPILISEHGLTEKGMIGCPYTRNRDWRIIEALNHQTVQFIQRPENLEKVIPFILVKGLWGVENGYPYPWVLQHKQKDGSWKKTDLYKYYEFWNHLNGKYIYTTSSEIDVQAVSFADNKKLNIVLNNLEEDKEVNISVPMIKGNKAKKCYMRSLYQKDGNAIITEKSLSLKNMKIALHNGETVIVTIDYEKGISPKESINTQKYYATSYLKEIKKDLCNSFDININRGNKYYAVLKIGIARPNGANITPKLTLNGITYQFPNDWKGYDQKSRTKDGFFGIIDVPINPKDLKDKNNISLTFDSNGGTISSVGMAVDYKE